MNSGNKNFEDLVIDYFSGKISEEDQHILTDLLKTDKDYKDRFEEMNKLFAVSFAPIFESEKLANFESLMDTIHNESSNNLNFPWIYKFGRVAAIIVFVVSVSVSSFYIYRDVTKPNDSAICYETITPKGSQTKIILPDSSVVWLNSGSSLKYNQSFGKKTREVILVGEGYFIVKKDSGKPFYVHTGYLDIKDLGTRFNVSSYKEDDHVEVNLIEGIVDITLPGINVSDSKIMKPNEKLVYNKLTNKATYYQADASKSALWTTGKLCFVDATIEQILKDLERKYNVEIQVSNSKIKKEHFSGSLDLNLSLKEILLYIDVDKIFILKQVGDTIQISSKN